MEKVPGRKPYSNEEIIKKIYELYIDDGLCLREITDKLNTLGIKTSRNSEWARSSILYVLKNPANYKKGYISEQKYNEIIEQLNQRQSKNPYSNVEVITKIYSLYLDEVLSVSEIAAKLNSLGLKTKRNKEWSQSTVGYVLRSSFNVDEGYVSKETYDLAMERYRKK